MKVTRTAVKTELINIKMLKTDKEDSITVDNEFNSQLDLKVKVMKFN